MVALKNYDAWKTEPPPVYEYDGYAAIQVTVGVKFDGASLTNDPEAITDDIHDRAYDIVKDLNRRLTALRIPAYEVIEVDMEEVIGSEWR